MSQLNELLTQANLAFAAYANLSIGLPDKQALKVAGMTDTQAADFVSKWTVAAHYTDASGAAATVFQENATGKKYLAIRGTEGIGDINADYILALGFPSYLSPQFIQLRSQVENWISNGTLSSGFTISGHSLGGYLAAAIGTWFSGQAGELYLYNAPSIGGLVGNVLDAFRAVFGFSDAALVSGITSVRGTAGISLISGLGAQLAPPLLVETESGINPIDNHSIIVLTDTLALYAVYAQVDPTARIETITNIIKTSSNLNGNTLEIALDNLRELFLGARVSGTVPEGRESYYTNLYPLSDWLDARNQGSAPALKLDALTAYDSGTLAIKALANTPEGLAYRYALTELNPFAITGDVSIYASYNAAGELTLCNPATGTGELTGQYLNDRAEMLQWKMLYDTVGLDYGERLDLQWYKSGDYIYQDAASGLTLDIDGFNPATFASHLIKFGDAGNDFLVGGALEDRLFGGGGSDTLHGGDSRDVIEGNAGDDVLYGESGSDYLYGQQGNDSLTGGTGNDVLDGGENDDCYYYSSGDGNDVINADGRLLVDNHMLINDYQNNTFKWRQAA